MRNLQSVKLLKSILCAAAILAANQSFAQDKNVIKAKQAMARKNWKQSYAMAEKAVEKDKNATEWWYIKAASAYELSNFEKLKGGKINYPKESVKAAVKAREKDKNNRYYDTYQMWMVNITAANNKDAMSNYSSGRYSRAIQMYRSSFDLTGDTIAYGMLGMSYLKDRQERDGIKILKQVAVWNFGAWANGSSKSTWMREPFEELSNYYLKNKFRDSASMYTEMGLQVFPKNTLLKNNARLMMEQDLTAASKKGYNQDYIAVVNKALSFFPDDSLFLYAQTYYYISRLNHLTRSKPYDEAKSTLIEFYTVKNQAVKAGVVNSYDDFLIGDSVAFLFKCLDYFLRRNNNNAIAFSFSQWYPAQTKTELTETKYEELLKSPPANISRKLLTILYAHAREDYPKNKKIMQYRLDFFNQWLAKSKSKNEMVLQQDMAEALVLDYPKDLKLAAAMQSLISKNIDSAIKDGSMYTAWKNFHKLNKYGIKGKSVDELNARLSAADFKIRYAGTRIDYSTVKGIKKANTGWNGNSLVCDAGRLPDSTLSKVLDRLNYFRANAGVITPMTLSLDRVRKCQEAATMFAPKGIFSREPKRETHECFTTGAAEAAANSQAILESNPAQCVTIFMDDKKSEELVNRLSVLHPGSNYVGFGSAENNSVFWLLDLEEAADTQYYKNNFVAWPNKQCPKMLMFKRWSFSIAQDVNGAKVLIKDKTGAEVKAGSAEYPLKSMMLNTLVITPEIQTANIAAGDYFDVVIELKNKKKYNYRITVF
jgi:hypothetical protein